MKKNHEMRIEMVTSIDEERKAMFYYMGQISGHNSPIHWEKTTPAMLPERYPAEKPAIELGIKIVLFVIIKKCFGRWRGRI